MTKARDNATQGGLVLLTPGSAVNGSISTGGGINFTNASVVGIDNIFSSAYPNYRIVINSVLASAGADMRIRLRSSATANTSSNYRFVRSYIDGTGSGGNSASNSDTSFSIGGLATSYGFLSIDLAYPNIAQVTTFSSFGVQSASTFYREISAGMFNGTNQFDGIEFYPGSSTFSGNIKIYGYK